MLPSTLRTLHLLYVTLICSRVVSELLEGLLSCPPPSDIAAGCLDEGAAFIKVTRRVVAFLDVTFGFYGPCHAPCLLDLDPNGDILEVEVFKAVQIDIFFFFNRTVTIFLCRYETSALETRVGD